MGRHNHQVSVELRLSVYYSLPRLADFDYDCTIHLWRYGGQHLLDLLASELNLRLEHFATGDTFGSSLIDQRIDLHDVENEQDARAIRASDEASVKALAEF
jgi:hypothetical protein